MVTRQGVDPLCLFLSTAASRFGINVRPMVLRVGQNGNPLSRRSLTIAGIRGIFTSRYVFAAAAFATLGGTLFGYE
jgi:hypothetical protein